MAHIGHPLIGDGKYGVNRADRERGYKYQALYAYRLIFDFADESGVLGYLRGKEVRLPDDAVWFLKDFEGGSVKTAPASHTPPSQKSARAAHPSHSKTTAAPSRPKTPRAQGGDRTAHPHGNRNNRKK
jgi:hypothetical protein